MDLPWTDYQHGTHAWNGNQPQDFRSINRLGFINQRDHVLFGMTLISWVANMSISVGEAFNIQKQ